MRTIYKLLLMALVPLVLALPPARSNAQTFNCASYLVRTVSEPYVPLADATPAPGIVNDGIFSGNNVSNSIPLPFPFRLADLSGITSVRVSGNGNVICSQSWNSNFDNYGRYPWEIYSGENAFGYPNYTIYPWNGFNYNAPGTSWSYGVVGTAPNRKFIIQTDGVNSETVSSVFGSWQVVLYEAGVSTIQINYQQTGTGTWYDFGSGISTGIKSNGAFTTGELAIDANPSTPIGAAPATTAVGYYDNQYYSLPGYSFRIFIAYPSDLSADLLRVPAASSILNLGVPITPTVTIGNPGSTRPASATYRLSIQRQGDATTAYSADVTINGAQIPVSFTTTSLSFPTFVPAAYGIYTATLALLGASVLPTADQNPANNSVSNQFTVSPPNDIMAVGLLNPPPNVREPVNISTPIVARFWNIGSHDQINVPLTAVIQDPLGNVIYRDTIYAGSFPSGKVLDTTFKEWVPALTGNHSICVTSMLSTDALRANDTYCMQIPVRYEADVTAQAASNPQLDEEKPYMTSWKPQGVFQSTGVSDLFDVPARVQIKRCSDGALVFQADSTIPELNIDQGAVKFSFPSKQGQYDIATLPPGCYTECVIARYPTDGDRSNDSACTSFSIIDRLKGRILVGVGQRFQSLHAAFDSMKFRGVGGPLQLVLTDKKYREDGSYTSGYGASSTNGALDFSNINGISETSPVTFMPLAGVTPTIVFAGSQPNCFYLGDKSPNSITFDGYNPIGAPVPDAVTPEPSKRGITIVDSETNAGSVFAAEWGPSHLTLRNLRIVGNGRQTSDASQAIRFFIEPTRQSYGTGVRDTVPMHDNLVENCEISNARTGIYAHGARTQFSLGPSTYLDFTNYNNTFTRNTIGTQSGPIGLAGIQFNNEHNLTISHNEIAWVNATLGGSANAYGIAQGSVLRGDTGNVYQVWVDANKVHNLTGSNVYGIAFQQAATIYSNGSGVNAVKSTLKINTQNRTTNNMIYDLRGSTSVYPLTYLTYANNYFTDKDSVFNNTISTNNATVNIYISGAMHAFVWNNVIQNTSNGATTNYYLQLPRPFTSAVSSDFNLFDLRGNAYTFAQVREYDKQQGTFIQSRTFRRLNDWRTYTNQDIHSLTGDPMFSSDSLHLPNALSYIASPASNNGAWLGTATQLRDFDGELRLQGNATPDIGADEFDGFQYTNDLGVQAILQPGGTSPTSDTTFVTMENPLWITAPIKNYSSQAVFNRTATATVEYAQAGGPWQTLFSQTTAPMNFDVNETKNVTFHGPTLNQAQTLNSVYRVTVSVPNDQNNTNNTQVKVFRVLLKTQAIVVSYDGSTARGRQNRDSVVAALNRLGLGTGYDLLDRTAYANQDVDYTPWWTMIWSGGDATTAFNGLNGSGALSFKETQDVERYLQAGRSYARKSLVMAGQNIAFYNDFSNINGNNVTDQEFTRQYLHTTYVANSPTGGAYAGLIVGQNPVYWKFSDNINSTSPDVVKPSITTPQVGPEVAGFAYSYASHPSTPADSGAGTSYTGATMNTVFYGFDWADAIQTSPSEAGSLTSGTTRVLKGALDFIQSHAGTILPVEFTAVDAKRVNNAAVVTWSTAHQSDVARFDIQTMDAQNSWSNIGSVDANTFVFTQPGVEPTKTYTYRVVAVDNSGVKTYSNAVEMAPADANAFTLGQNYPNPFNPSTTISYTLPVNAMVTFRILDVTGKVVRTEMTNEAVTAGSHTVTLTLDNLASGSYVYEMVAVQPNGESVVLSRKMTLSK